MPRKQPMTIEEHAEYGKLLKTFLHAGHPFNRFPKASREVSAMKKAFDAVQHLRWVMENALCELVPVDDPTWDWSKFYTGDAAADPRRYKSSTADGVKQSKLAVET